MNLVEIGWVGKAHGLKGEIKAHIQEFYEKDLLAAKSVHIGEPPVPYFLQYVRAGGVLLLKFENLDEREQVALLSNRPLFLMEGQVAQQQEMAGTPFDALIGYRIEAEGYPTLGPITGIMDLPSHHLAELQHGGKDVLVPLHEDLIIGIDEQNQLLRMVLPEGLLDLD